jgi:hypothetical protein
MKVLKYILYIYLFIGSGFAIKYNYDYAKENSFGDWLMFGEIVSTLKGFAWPYYLLDNSEKQEEKKKFSDANEFKNSIVYLQEAFAVEGENVNSGYGLFTDKSYYNKSNELRKKALNESSKVSLNGLKMVDEELAVAYEKKFIKGLELYFEGLRVNDKETIENSSELLNEFGEVYRSWAE